MKYLRKFNNHTEYEADMDNLIRPNVSLCVTENEVHYNPIDYSIQYLTFVALEDGTFSFNKKGTGNDIQYSIDNGSTWTELAANTNSPTVSAGSKILWKGELTPTYNGIGTFSSTGQFNVEGNPMSLLFGDEFMGQTSLNGKDYAFYNLFLYATNLISAENLSLPATTLTRECYQFMFEGCTSLTEAPELPATTLAHWCYIGMFKGCTSLTTAPELPATTLAFRCYMSMFKGCSALTTAPELPVTALEEQCYDGMFEGCTSLTTAPELPATTLKYCCYASMFSGCKSLTTAPQLPATTLQQECYSNMFNGCRSLNYIKCLATNISVYRSTYNWVSGVASIGTFVKDASMTNWTTGTSGIPNGWTVQDA